MPSKKKKPGGGQKRKKEAELAELEALRKRVAEQDKELEAEEARKEEEKQAKGPTGRRQRTLVRWDGMCFAPFPFLFCLFVCARYR